MNAFPVVDRHEMGLLKLGCGFQEIIFVRNSEINVDRIQCSGLEDEG